MDDLLKLSQRAHGFTFPFRQPLVTGRRASKLSARGPEVDELHRSTASDGIRAIDWAEAKRHGTPYRLSRGEERDRPVMLLVDQRQSMFLGKRRATKSVVAAEVAALAAFRVTALGAPVGGIVFSEQGVSEIEPHASDAGAHRLLAEVARHNNALRADPPYPPNRDLYNEALRRVARLAGHDWLVVMISDGLGRNTDSLKLAARQQVTQVSVERAIPVLPIRTDVDPAQQLRGLIGGRMRHVAA
jgi:uncharacterized protein (DUF58 family)